MPRQTRKKSSTNIYHVVVRGVNRQTMFEEAKDYIKYLDMLLYYKEKYKFKLFAYCLMSNHVHLVLQTADSPISSIFQGLNTRYAIWYNMKYQRCGHLQQERYYSEPIESEKYLLTAIRYVHRNPCKANLETSPGISYKWSSIYEYIDNSNNLIDNPFIYSIISQDKFIEFNNVNANDKCIDIDNLSKRIPDDVAKDILFSISKCKATVEFQNLDLLSRDKYLHEAINQGLSIRQLSRLTGVSTGVIQKVLQNQRDNL